MAMALAMALDFAHTGNKIVFKLLGFVCALTFAITIGYSRLFLGVHSLDQVLFGLLLGAWVALTMQYCVRPGLEFEVKQLIECQVTDFKKRFWICWIVFTFLMVF